MGGWNTAFSIKKVLLFKQHKNDKYWILYLLWRVIIPIQGLGESIKMIFFSSILKFKYFDTDPLEGIFSKLILKLSPLSDVNPMETPRLLVRMPILSGILISKRYSKFKDLRNVSLLGWKLCFIIWLSVNINNTKLWVWFSGPLKRQNQTDRLGL